MLCSRDLDVVRAQRIMGFLNLNYPQVNAVRRSDHVVAQPTAPIVPTWRVHCDTSNVTVYFWKVYVLLDRYFLVPIWCDSLNFLWIEAKLGVVICFFCSLVRCGTYWCSCLTMTTHWTREEWKLVQKQTNRYSVKTNNNNKIHNMGRFFKCTLF